MNTLKKIIYTYYPLAQIYNLCSESIFLRAYLGVNMFPTKPRGNKIFIIVGAYHKIPGIMCCSLCEPTCDFAMFKIVLFFYIENAFEKEITAVQSLAQLRFWRCFTDFHRGTDAVISMKILYHHCFMYSDRVMCNLEHSFTI